LLTFALDTSTPSPSLAITRGDSLLGELWLGPEPGAGRRVLEGAHHLLAALEIDFLELERIVVGVGPGGFTGLRIGLATADALGQSIGCAVVGVVSLEALAAGVAESAQAGTLILAAHDARRSELFAAAYLTGPAAELTEVLPPVALGPAPLAARIRSLVGAETPVVAVGSGAIVGADALRDGGIVVPPADYHVHRLRAAALVGRVRAGTGRSSTPVYARLPDAEVNRLKAAGGRA
jgi:tRNA threonylcarbamoyladenosine biosynthesis protein TsaB